MSLDIEKSYRAIIKAARAGRFITYGDVAAASNVEWKKARLPLPQQLGELVRISHERGWPLISSIVVNRENIETGKLEGESLSGIMAAVKKLGVLVADPTAFIKEQQQAVFAWAKAAPDELGVLGSPKNEVKGPAGPRFVQYFEPVLEALRAAGGEAAPDMVYAWIKQHVDSDDLEPSGLTKSGQSKFENRVGWARFYLAKAGLIDGGTRGVWKLTEDGRNTTLSSDDALALFQDIRRQFKAAADEEDSAPWTIAAQELFADPTRNFWFVGASWGGYR